MAHAEHGTDEDAPNDWEDAWTVEPGTIKGWVRWASDWYRIEIPEGQALNLTFLATDNDARLTVLEDDGRRLGKIQRGVQDIAVPSGPALRLGVSSTGSGLDYEIQTSLEAAPTGDDASLGVDAGNYWLNATDLPTGPSHAGSFEGDLTDPADWFRIQGTTEEWVTIDVSEMGKRTDVELRSPDGSLIDSGTWGTTATFETSVPAEWLLLGFLDRGSDYAFSITRHQRPNLAVTGLDVTHENLTTDAGDLPTGTQRTVDVGLANLGPGSSVDGWLQVWVTHELSTGTDQRRVLHDGPITLAPGEERTLAITWDGTGELGDATVHALVSSRFDLDAQDDRMEQESYVVVGNTGPGVDLLNQRVNVRPGVPLVRNPQVLVDVGYGVHGAELFAKFLPPAVGVVELGVLVDNGGVEPSGKACVMGICGFET